MKLVFTMTQGRTGSRSLAATLAANLPGADVHHEQLGMDVRLEHSPSAPLMLRFNSRGNVAEVQDWWRTKLGDILDRPTDCWVETSHLLMKAGLIENLLPLARDHDIHLVALRRDRASLLRSYVRIGDFTRIGNRQMWYLDEKAPRNLLKPTALQGRSAMGLALWYILEIECRVAWYQRLLADQAGVTLHELKVKELAGSPALDRLVGALRGPDVAGPTRTEPVHNAGPKRVLDEQIEADMATVLAEVADFDAEAWVDRLVQRRPQPFVAASAPRPLGDPDDGDGPGEVFIGGPGRSGTTALVDLMGLHPRLAPIYETEFLPACLVALSSSQRDSRLLAQACLAYLQDWSQQVFQRQHEKSPHERYVHGPHHLPFDQAACQREFGRFAMELQQRDPWAALRGMVQRLFAAGAAADGKARWVNKTPVNVLHATRLLALFPRSRFILCVRDPRDVAGSVLKKSWGPERMDQLPGWWLANLVPGLLARELYPDRVRLVRYEDLLCTPQRTLNGLLAWLGEEPCAAAMLERYAAEGLALDPSRIGRWRDRLTADERTFLQATLGVRMDELGYGPSS